MGIVLGLHCMMGRGLARRVSRYEIGILRAGFAGLWTVCGGVCVEGRREKQAMEGLERSL